MSNRRIWKDFSWNRFLRFFWGILHFDLHRIKWPTLREGPLESTLNPLVLLQNPWNFHKYPQKNCLQQKSQNFWFDLCMTPTVAMATWAQNHIFSFFVRKDTIFFDILCTFTWKSICCPERYWFHLYKTSLECLNILLVIRFFASSFRQKCQNCDLGLRSHPHNFCGQGPRFLKKAWMSLLI